MSSEKPSNPKDAMGILKVPFSTIPMGVVAELGLAMLEGARKYGRHNYRVIGVRTSVYLDACLRHLTAFWEGEDIDPKSGLPHIVKAMACLAVLRDAQMVGMCTDDRPPSLPVGWQERMEAMVAEVLSKYPECKPPFVKETTYAEDEFPPGPIPVAQDQGRRDD